MTDPARQGTTSGRATGIQLRPPRSAIAGRLMPHRRARAATDPVRLPYRDSLNQHLQGLRHSGSPQRVADILAGPDQLWWKCCQEAVQQDPAWLFEPDTGALREWVHETAAADGWALDDCAFIVARALGAPPDSLPEQLTSLRGVARTWDRTGLLIPSVPPGSGVVGRRAALAEDMTRRIEPVIATLQPSVGEVVAESEAARTMVQLTALLLAGALPRKHRVVRVSVVFGLAEGGNEHGMGIEQGIAGFLELRELPAGPAGLFPDPQAMAQARSSGHAFAESLAHARDAAAWRTRGRCVLWRIVLADDPAPISPIEGGSLGAAFAVGLRELFRYPVSRPPAITWVRRLFYGLRPRNAVTGIVSGNAGHLQRVTAIGAKLHVAHQRKWTLIAPKANQPDIVHAPDPSMVKFAATVRQAERYARQWRKGRVTVTAAVIAVAAVTGTIAAYQAAADARRQEAATIRAERELAVFNQVTAYANQLQNSDPSLAARLDLAAYHLRRTPDVIARLIDAENAPLAATLSGHTAPVLSVAFSPDGRTLASGDNSGTVRFWDVSDPVRPRSAGQPFQVSTNRLPVQSVAFSPHGHMLAIASWDGTIRLWGVTDPAHPRASGTAQPDASPLFNSVAFSPDGRTLASGDDSGIVQLWDVTDPAHPRALGAAQSITASTLWVNSVAFSSDGRMLAAGGYGGTIRLWDVTNPARPHAIGGILTAVSNVQSLTFSPDSSMLASGNFDGTVQIWDVADPGHARTLSNPLTVSAAPINAVAFSRDSRTLAGAGSGGMIRLWDVVDNPAAPQALGPPLASDTGGIQSLAFSPDGGTLASADHNGTVQLWSLPRTTLTDPNGPVNSVAYSPDRRTLVTGDSAGIWLVKVSDPGRPSASGQADANATDVNAVAFSPDGKTVASSADSDTIQLWDVADPANPQASGQAATSGANVTSVTFSPHGQTLAAGDEEGAVWLWDTADPAHSRELGHADTGSGAVNSVAFRPDGGLLAVGGGDGTIELWNTSNAGQLSQIGQPLTVTSGTSASVTTVAFSPDGRTLAAGNDDGTLRIVDVADPARPRVLGPPVSGGWAVHSVAFSPDGRLLASGNAGGTFQLWDITNPASPQAYGPPLTGHIGDVNAVAFSPDGRILVSAGADGTVRIWHLNADDAIQWICATTSGTLTAPEWHTYIPQLPYQPSCTS